jgi:septum formation protein
MMMNTADPTPPPLSAAASTASRDPAPAVILASASSARAEMLHRAGVVCTIEPARVDEDEVKRGMRASGAGAAELAETLAELKGRKISARHGGALVIGADQVLNCQSRWFDKPADRAQARTQLLALRGKLHELISCVCVIRDGQRLWHHVGRARLTMRPFTEEFLDDYLDRAGDAVLQSVGAYQLEGLGAQLFSRVDGDYFTILGLPLLPLLDFLRNHGVVRA